MERGPSAVFPCRPPTLRRIASYNTENNAHILRNRQRKVINRLLDGFEGKLTTSKWAKLTKCSQDTALRDIHDLLDRGVLTRDAAGGRSASYELAPPS